MRYEHIAIEGLIGVGKTTLAKRLSERFQTRLILEEFEENPFLPRFYADKEPYAFSVELSFLAQRYHQFKKVAEQDLFDPFTIADHYISKSLIFAQANLSDDEFKLFSDLYNIMQGNLVKPQLLVYLHLEVNELLKRIDQRGRDYEKAITAEYLNGLQKSYFDHLSQLIDIKVLVIDASDIDLKNSDEELEKIAELLDMPYRLGMNIHSFSET